VDQVLDRVISIFSAVPSTDYLLLGWGIMGALLSIQLLRFLCVRRGDDGELLEQPPACSYGWFKVGVVGVVGVIFFGLTGKRRLVIT
jgi:hypothetical protein